MSKVTDTSARKSNHIRINLEEDVQSGLTTGLERISFSHSALPELDLHQIDLSTNFLEKRLNYPIIIMLNKKRTRPNHTLCGSPVQMNIFYGKRPLGKFLQFLLVIFFYPDEKNSDGSECQMGPFRKRHFQDKHRDGNHNVDRIKNICGHWPVQQSCEVNKNASKCR